MGDRDDGLRLQPKSGPHVNCPYMCGLVRRLRAQEDDTVRRAEPKTQRAERESRRGARARRRAGREEREGGAAGRGRAFVVLLKVVNAQVFVKL